MSEHPTESSLARLYDIAQKHADPLIYAFASALRAGAPLTESLLLQVMESIATRNAAQTKELARLKLTTFEPIMMARRG